MLSTVAQNKEEMAKLEIHVQSRSGKKLADLVLPADATVDDLSSAFHAHHPLYTPSRQWFTFASEKATKPVHLDAGKSLASYGIVDQSVLVFKDLGPQVSWKTVFLIEYFGPLLIHPALYFTAPSVYGDFKMTQMQLVVMGMMVLHFLKRELETLFVHRFSHATMPVKNIFKNSFHYWILSGVWLAFDVYSPSFAAKSGNLTKFDWVLVGVFLWAELSNLSTHITLRNLRPPGTKVRRIPYGYGFDAPFGVSCPNYFFETVAWLCVVGMTRTIGGTVFLIAAVYQMYVWALKKHRQYKKEFADYPKSRKAMFPYMS